MKASFKVKTNKGVVESLKSLSDGSVKVGWWGGQTEPNGLLVAENAYLQNKGFTIKHKNGTETQVPPRPFMQIAVNENVNKWNSAWKKEYKKVLDGKSSLKNALNYLGEVIRTSIKSVIRSNVKPANAPSTLKARKRKGNYNETTLMDSLTMYNTIQYNSEVKRK